MILKFEDKEIELYSTWYEYLYPYLIRFSLKHNVDMNLWSKKNIIYISNENRKSFVKMLENVFEELMKECYIEPTHKQRSKYSTRYQKIEYKGKVYVLDYRTNIVGKIGYALNFLINDIGIDMSSDEKEI